MRGLAERIADGYREVVRWMKQKMCSHSEATEPYYYDEVRVEYEELMEEAAPEPAEAQELKAELAELTERAKRLKLVADAAYALRVWELVEDHTQKQARVEAKRVALGRALEQMSGHWGDYRDAKGAAKAIEVSDV